MRLSLDWLAEWIDLPAAAGARATASTSAASRTRWSSRSGRTCRACVVGQVLERATPPERRPALACAGWTSATASRSRSSAARPTWRRGQKVAVAVAGHAAARRHQDQEVEDPRRASRPGMICSERELGLGDDHDGILVLDPRRPVGRAALRGARSWASAILEVGITPNRGDTASLLGVAREVRALFGGELRVPETQPAEDGPRAAEAISVAIEAAEACHHYVARVVRGRARRAPRRTGWCAGSRPRACARSTTSSTSRTSCCSSSDSRCTPSISPRCGGARDPRALRAGRARSSPPSTAQTRELGGRRPRDRRRRARRSRWPA